MHRLLPVPPPQPDAPAAGPAEATAPPAWALRLWQHGQDLLARGQYVAADRWLTRAENAAFRQRNPASLSRLYLPLLEARRQWRHQACGGTLLRLDTRQRDATGLLRQFIRQPAGVLLVSGPRAPCAARTVGYTAARTGALLEAMVLLEHAGHWRAVSPACPRWADGIAARQLAHLDEVAPPCPHPLVVQAPPPGLYEPSGDLKHPALHDAVAETILLGWEALATHWQTRRRRPADAWGQLAWLRHAAQVDRACEPVLMKMIALAETLAAR